jgi:hypothetical protein
MLPEQLRHALENPVKLAIETSKRDLAWFPKPIVALMYLVWRCNNLINFFSALILGRA